jgi:hypothetical protein
MESSLAAAAAMLLVVHVAKAQQIRGTISLSGGSATDVLGVTSRAATISPALTVTRDPNTSFTFSANGTRFDNAQWSATGAFAAAFRAPLTAWASATLDADANTTKTSYHFSYASAGVLPALELAAGPLTTFAGARLVAGSGGATGMSSSHTSAGELAGVALRFAGVDGGTMVVGARIEHAHVDSIAQLDRTATLALYRGSVALSGALGIRSEPSSRSAFGNVALSIAVSPTTAIEFDAGTYPANRLVGTPAGHFMNIGASLNIGATRPHAPRARGAPAITRGLTRLTVRASPATRVEIAGDFTNWQPIVTQRAENGVWYIDLRIPPGQYRYAFRVDGTQWIIPSGVEVVDDGFGGKSAWLVVSAP